MAFGLISLFMIKQIQFMIHNHLLYYFELRRLQIYNLSALNNKNDCYNY